MPRELAAFLNAGRPPVYFGFGSVPGLEPAEMAEMIRIALEQTGNRGILATGGGAIGAGAPSPNIYFVADAPHDRLFPHVSSIVHHGGAGTTGASLRAGKPIAICPFFGDQPFWARRVSQLGAAPPPLDRRALSPTILAHAIAQMEQREMRQRAAELGAAISQEDGVASAIRFIFSRA
jgi:UDP:flavonoid glycosyltransferase YjiC (YdhE family)